MTTRIEFGSKAAADAARDEYEEYLCSDDDRRLKPVAFADQGTPEHVIEDARRQAADSKTDSGESAGSAALTDAEREEIDFTETDVMTARAAKAAYLDEGVSDWLTYWSEDLTTTGEAREAAKRAKKDEQDTRMDAGPTGEERGQQYQQQAIAQECDHIRGHCENGDTGACEFLQERCGYDQEEIEQLLDERPAETEQEELVTIGGDEYPEMEVTPEVAGALRQAWQGYKGGTADLEAALGEVRESVINTRQAWRAINRIREANDQAPLHPDRLHTLLDALAGMPASIPEVRTLTHFTTDGADDQGEAADEGAEAAESSASERVLEVAESAQADLTGERQRPDQQSELAIEADPRTAQGRESTAEAAVNQGGLLADERDDPSMGAESGQESTDQQQFRDPEQGTLSDS
ncbi:hypothetical protein [Halomicrobium urmianum]|uniref:hypothetical protein n=1 Tax=Halomicrobium urmianum TaxID=1586233 RepID=UPI001CD9B33E|nr:hypothetical protein [Halomicrobium urmianum]